MWENNTSRTIPTAHSHTTHPAGILLHGALGFAVNLDSNGSQYVSTFCFELLYVPDGHAVHAEPE
jgi:hypothetical protein